MTEISQLNDGFSDVSSNVRGEGSPITETPRTPSPIDVLRSYFTTEMTRDIDAIMAHFAPDAIFTSPTDVRVGHDQIRPFYEDARSRFPSLSVTIVTGFDDGLDAVAEWDAEMSGPEAGSLSLKGVNVARVVGGLIVDVRSYYDAGSYRG